MTTPNEGVNSSLSLNEATDLFLSRWKDADGPSETDEGETSAHKDDATVHEEDNESDELSLEDLDNDEDEGEGAEDDDDEDASGKPEAGDDHRVKITVDGEEKHVTVKELKRLYGQEASLTRKSQEVAAARKAAEADAERYMISAQRLITKAQERFAPFEKIDWMVAQQRLTPDEFQVLRNEARDAETELKFLQAEAGDVLKGIQSQRQAEFAQAAKEAIKVLESDIPGWNREVYDQVRTFATSKGMAQEIVDQIIDPSAIKIIYDAMRYNALKQKAAQKKTQSKAAPKKVMKSGSKQPERIGGASRPNDKLNTLKKTGRRDDAAAAFMERWADRSDD